ncbi:hypothetical protein Hanom_Chr04g00371071 [Helianthus anomalus]
MLQLYLAFWVMVESEEIEILKKKGDWRERERGGCEEDGIILKD